MDENLKRLQKEIKKLDSYRVITTDELSSFLNDVANVLAQYRSATAAINTETKETLNTFVKTIDEAHTEIISKKKVEVEKYIDSSKEKLSSEVKPHILTFAEEQKNDIEKLSKKYKKVLEDIKAQVPKDGYTPVKGVDYFDGEKGNTGEKGMDGKDGSPDTPEEIVEKINLLDEQIEISAIKGLKDLLGKTKQVLSGGAKLLSYLLDVSITSPSDGQALVYDSTLQKWKNGSTSGGVSDGDKGDITVASSGASWTINDASVQMNDIDASGTPSGTTFLRGDGSWSTPAGSGDVSKVGTPVNNQVGVWTGDGTIEGDAALTFDTATDTLATGIVTVTDDAYGAGWNGSAAVPTKNAVYDKIESLSVGSGITRTVVTTSGSLTLGSTASTDYVYFVAGAHTLSMPSPNTNRYSIKNNHSANITIDTAGAETIEGAASIVIAPEESVDVMSDGTNWFVF